MRLSLNLPQHLMDQLQGDAGILPDLLRQPRRQPQAAHGCGLRQQQTPGDLRHLGAEVQRTAAPNAWVKTTKMWNIWGKSGEISAKNVGLKRWRKWTRPLAH